MRLPLSQQVRRTTFQLLAVALVLISTACTQKSAAVKVDGPSALVQVGSTIGFVLKGTNWTFHESSNPSVLSEVTTSESNLMCAPELGCGVTDGEYKGIAPGSVVVTATRDDCGGRRCVGDEGVHKFTVVVLG
jgi:hypothetical protein